MCFANVFSAPVDSLLPGLASVLWQAEAFNGMESSLSVVSVGGGLSSVLERGLSSGRFQGFAGSENAAVSDLAIDVFTARAVCVCGVRF